MNLINKIRNFIHNIFSVKITLGLMIIGLVIGLSASLISQYFFDFKPCKLCLAQRVSFIYSLILICLSLKLFYNNNKYWTLFSYLSIIGLLSAFLFSTYQLLIQFGIIPEPEFCSVNTAIANKSIEDLEKMLENTSYVSSCKALGPTLLNMPISFFSCLGSLIGTTYLCITIFLYKIKNRSGFI